MAQRSGTEASTRSLSEAAMRENESRASCAPAGTIQPLTQLDNISDILARPSPLTATAVGAQPARVEAAGNVAHHRSKEVDDILQSIDRSLMAQGSSLHPSRSSASHMSLPNPFKVAHQDETRAGLHGQEMEYSHFYSEPARSAVQTQDALLHSSHSSSSSMSSPIDEGVAKLAAVRGESQAQVGTDEPQVNENGEVTTESPPGGENQAFRIPPFPFPSLDTFLTSAEEQRRVLPQLCAWFGYRMSREAPENQLPHVRQLHAGLAKGKTVEEVKISVKMKRRPDPEDPDPRKRPRRTWTPQAREAVVRASRNGPTAVKVVADALGMNINTARNFVRKAKELPNGEAFIDHRVGPQLNHPTKLKKDYTDWLRLWLEENCTLPVNTLQARLNQEISRAVLIKYGGLSDESEKSFGTAFNFEQHPFYESNVLAKAEYADQRIKAQSTINRWLANMLFTRKVAIQERVTANNVTNMRIRLDYCKMLHGLMTGSDVTLIFTDEIPFYIRQMRSYGRAKIGTRAVVQTAPGSKLGLRTQVALAVHPNRGVLHDVTCPPEYLSRSQMKSGGWKQQWNQGTFVSFMNGLLTKLADTIDEERRKKHDILGTRDMFIILDGAPEHGRGAMSQIFELGSYKRLKEQLAVTGKRIDFLKNPPISPMLNLTEYYNRTLRGISQQFLDKPENQRVMLMPPKGEAIRSRLQVLQEAIQFGVASIKEYHNHAKAFLKLGEYVEDVIAHDGMLDFRRQQ